MRTQTCFSCMNYPTPASRQQESNCSLHFWSSACICVCVCVCARAWVRTCMCVQWAIKNNNQFLKPYQTSCDFITLHSHSFGSNNSHKVVLDGLVRFSWNALHSACTGSCAHKRCTDPVKQFEVEALTAQQAVVPSFGLVLLFGAIPAVEEAL